MFPYFVLQLSLACLAALTRSRAKYLFLVIAAALFCTTYVIGSDWRVYEGVYLAGRDEYEITRYWYGLYLPLSELFSQHSIPFQTLLIAAKVLVYVALWRIMVAHFDSPTFIYAIFLTISGYQLFIDNPLRQFLALPFFFYAVESYGVKKYFKSLISLMMAMSFHPSALIAFFVILIPAASGKRGVINGVLLLAGTCLLLANFSLVANYFSGLYPPVGFYLRNYLYNSLSSYSLPVGSVLAYTFIWLGAMLAYLHRRSAPHRYGLRLSLAFLLTIYLAGFNPAILRLGHFYSVYFAVFVATSLWPVVRSKPFIRFIFVGGLSILPLNLLLSSSKYVPYQNYVIDSLLGQILPFEVRESRAINDYE